MEIQNKLDVFLVETTQDVFGVMLNWQVAPKATLSDLQRPKPFDLLDISGNIGFGGQLTGCLFLSVSTNLALTISRQVLGANVGHDEISDVIGELTNMLAGGCKRRLGDVGCNTVMSIPNIIRGQKIWANGKDVRFMIHKAFTIPANGEEFEVVLLGKLD